MPRLILTSLAVILLHVWITAAFASEPDRSGVSTSRTELIRHAALPTDRILRHATEVPFDADMARKPEVPANDERRLSPRFQASVEWQPSASDVGISSYDLSVQQPIYPVFGPPPPFINAGYSFTRIDAPASFGLPDSLHEYSLGMSWMRRINEAWRARVTLSTAFASDLDNTGTDAWQFRGGAFALYRPNEQWSYAAGVLATGRADLPVIPAVGLVWEPKRDVKVNLMMPNPRLSLLFAETTARQHWVYFGGGISGGTWAYQRGDGTNDLLSYGEWRLVAGWEFFPPQPPGTFRPSGPRFNAEIGYSVGRNFEFDSHRPDLSLSNALLLRTSVSF